MIEFVFETPETQVLGANDEGRREILRMSQSSDLGRARHLLHKDHGDQPQTMLILLEKGSVVGMHRHPEHKSEIYVVLEGQLLVEYTTDGGETRSRLLGPWGNDEQLPSISIHRDGIWHEPSAVTDYVLYLEIYSGPFNKELDVQYR